MPDLYTNLQTGKSQWLTPEQVRFFLWLCCFQTLVCLHAASLQVFATLERMGGICVCATTSAITYEVAKT